MSSVSLIGKTSQKPAENTSNCILSIIKQKPGLHFLSVMAFNHRMVERSQSVSQLSGKVKVMSLMYIGT